MVGFVVPDYPYDRLDAAREAAAKLPGGVVDLSVGTPTDPPPAAATASRGRRKPWPPQAAQIGTASLPSGQDRLQF